MRRVLICPLDWGLGHATRCVPVIKEFQRQGAEVMIASSGSALDFLRMEFPALKFFELPGYSPRYPRRSGMALKMLTQLPHLTSVASKEHAVIESLVREFSVDIVIADHRYGCWSGNARSIFLSHQLKLPMPRGAGIFSRVINSASRRYVRKFNECWIPDDPRNRIARFFDDPYVSQKRYVGWLSRFNAVPGPEPSYDIVGIISGPEPQRAIFEKMLEGQLKACRKRALMITGEPGKNYHVKEGSLEKINHLPSERMEKIIAGAAMVVSRSGYSTIMDLIAIGKRAIFVPTPQQPEQLYFSDYFTRQRVAIGAQQSRFDLEKILSQAENFTGFSVYQHDTSLLKSAVQQVMHD